MGFWNDVGDLIAGYLSHFKRLPHADTRPLCKAIEKLETAVSTLKGIASNDHP